MSQTSQPVSTLLKACADGVEKKKSFQYVNAVGKNTGMEVRNGKRLGKGRIADNGGRLGGKGGRRDRKSVV